MIVGITFGAFDLFHAGHVIFLEECRRRCDYLVVGLHVDPQIERMQKNRPVQSVYERFVQLRACKFVHDVVPYETELDLADIMASTPFDKRFLGSDYEGRPYTGWREDIKVVYIPRNHSFSTSELRARVSNAENEIRAM